MREDVHKNPNTFFSFVILQREKNGKYAAFANLVNIFRDKFPRSSDFETNNRFMQNSPAFLSYYKLFKELWALYKSSEQEDYSPSRPRQDMQGSET